MNAKRKGWNREFMTKIAKIAGRKKRAEAAQRRVMLRKTALKKCSFCSQKYSPGEKRKLHGKNSKRWKESKYCSTRCHFRAMNRKVAIRCAQCKIEFYSKPSHAKKTRYCSRRESDI